MRYVERMLATQKYLNSNSLENLTEQFGIKVKIYDDFIGLNYDQIKSPKSHPITMECRSLKLIRGSWMIASRAFDRFFNYGECPNEYAKFNFDHAIITEKVDGSIIPIWYNTIDKRWEISSKSAIFGESFLSPNKTYRETVLETFSFSEDEFQQFFDKNSDTNFTYIFEYIGPDNFIVTPYKDKQMVLLGIRHNFKNNEYCSLDEMESFVSILPGNVRMFKTYKLSSFENIIASMKELKGLEEGYVCIDTKHNLRVKIKSPQYVAMHHMRGENNVTKEGLINVVISGEIDELVTYFPHLKDKLESIQQTVNEFLETMKNVYNEIHHLELQKDFAKEAMKHKFSGLLFAARKNKTSIEHEFDLASNDYKVRLLLNIL